MSSSVSERLIQNLSVAELPKESATLSSISVGVPEALSAMCPCPRERSYMVLSRLPGRMKQR